MFSALRRRQSALVLCGGGEGGGEGPNTED